MNCQLNSFLRFSSLRLTKEEAGISFVSMAKERVVLDDVARDAGVSRSTVSLVLRGNPVVARATAERVLASIRRLGYVYNRNAAALRSRKTHSVGIIEANIKNAFFSAMSVGVEKELDKAGMAILWANAAERVEKQARAIEVMLEYGVDGLLICPAAGTRREDLEILTAHQVPFVLFCRHLPGLGGDYIGAANRRGAEDAVRHLLSLGHRNLVFVGGSPVTSPWRDRTGGFVAALREAGLPAGPEMLYPAETSIAAGAAMAREILAASPRPTAALCYTDIVALGLMMGLENEGVRPGRDFGVVGFDNLDEAALYRPPLTTVACPPEPLGAEAARLLLGRIDNPEAPPARLEIPSPLVVRESCGAPAALGLEMAKP